MQINKEKIAERLKKSRDNAGLTQQQLADQADLGRSTIMHYENAKSVPGGIELAKLSTALNTSPNYILTGSEEFGEPTSIEHSFATDNQYLLMARATIFMPQLDRETQEKFSELIMTMVMQRIDAEKFELLNEFANDMAATMEKTQPIWDEIQKQNEEKSSK